MPKKSIFGRIWDAIKPKATPPPPPTPPRTPRATPPRTPRHSATTPRSEPAPRISYAPRSSLPPEWGSTRASLWQDATKTNGTLGRDRMAQRYYEAAFHTRSDTPGDRADAQDTFKQYIMDTYGIDWDEVFDYAEYRRNYDLAVT